MLPTSLVCQEANRSKPSSPLRQDPWRVLRKLPLHEHAENGWDLLVRDEDGRAMQADVIVYEQVTPARSVMEWAQGYGSHYHVAIAARSESRAERYRTDADGTVRIAKRRVVQCIAIGDGAVSHPVAAGLLKVLTMRPHRRVMLEAIGAQGRPAAYLAMAIVDGRDRAVAHAVTDVIGRCTFYVPWASDNDQPALSVRPLIVARTPPTMAIAGDYFEGKSRMMRIELPPVGSVRVQLAKPVKTSGTPPYVSLFALTQSGRIATASVSQPHSLVDGERVIPFVALGQRVKVSVAAAEHHMQIGAGPTKAGEVVTIKVDTDPVTVVGQLLDTDGKPIAKRDLSAWISSATTSHSWELHTDQDGRFAVDLFAPLIVPGPTRVEIDATKLSTDLVPHGHFQDTVNSRAPRAARVVEWPDTGRVDLGTLRMQLAAEMLTGTVVDSAGDPVAGVTLQAKTGWARPSLYRAVSAADGKFAFYAENDGAAANSNLQLRVSAKDWRRIGVIEADIGDSVEVQVAPICSIEFRLANELLAAMLGVYLIGKDGGRHRSYPRDGTFQFRGLPPGGYTLQLELAGGVVKRVEDIEVVHARPNTQAGIAWLDGVHMVTIQVRTPEGTAIEAKGSIVSAESRSSSVPSTAAGELRLPYLDGQELLLESAEHRSKQIKPTSDTMQVVMQPRADLRVRAPAGLTLPRETRVRFDGSPEAVRLRAAGATRLRPDASGATYLTLIIPDGRGGYDEVHSQAVQLPDDAQPMELVLQVTAEIVAEANRLAALGRATRAARLRR